MGSVYVTAPCADCGKPCNRFLDYRQGRRCIECAIARQATHNRNVHHKRGPEWTAMLYRWRDGLIRELRAAGIPTDMLTVDDMAAEVTAPQLSKYTRRHLAKVAAGATDRVPRRSRAESNAARRDPETGRFT